ncbi:MAG: glycoside hydrolase, partial [Bacteroidales bacterium]|nr:glycoside hydrolase [Bacteroidales bacterium]
GDNSFPQTLEIDLGSVQKISRVMTQFEFASYYYQYLLEYSANGKKWAVYADRSDNRVSGSPMIDDKEEEARYLRLKVLGTEKTGLYAAVWNIKAYGSAFDIPLGLVNKASEAGPGAESKREMLLGFDISKKSENLSSLPNQGTLGGNFTLRGEVSVSMDDLGVQALEFTRGSLVLDVPVPQQLAWNGSFSVATWVRNPEAGREGDCLFSWCDRHALRLANSYNALFYNRSGHGAMAHLDGHFDMRYRSLPAENEWHHIVVTFDGVLEKMYVNGVLDNVQSMTLASAVDRARFIVGASDVGENFSGYMASLRMYDYALSQKELGKLMKKTRPENLKK